MRYSKASCKQLRLDLFPVIVLCVTVAGPGYAQAETPSTTVSSARSEATNAANAVTLQVTSALNEVIRLGTPFQTNRTLGIVTRACAYDLASSLDTPVELIPVRSDRVRELYAAVTQGDIDLAVLPTRSMMDTSEPNLDRVEAKDVLADGDVGHEIVIERGHQPPLRGSASEALQAEFLKQARGVSGMTSGPPSRLIVAGRGYLARKSTVRQWAALCASMMTIAGHDDAAFLKQHLEALAIAELPPTPAAASCTGCVDRRPTANPH